MNRRLPLILFLTLLASLSGRIERSIGAPADSSFERDIRTLQEGTAEERVDAAQNLGANPGVVRVAVPALLDAMRSEADNRVVTSIRSALIAIGQPAVPHIVAKLSDWPSERLRELVVALAVIGPQARSAIPELQRLQTTRDANLQRCITFALNSIQPSQSSPAGLNETSAAKGEREFTSPQVPAAANAIPKQRTPFTIAGKVTSPPEDDEARPLFPQLAADGNPREEVDHPTRIAPSLPLDAELIHDVTVNAPETVEPELDTTVQQRGLVPMAIGSTAQRSVVKRKRQNTTALQTYVHAQALAARRMIVGLFAQNRIERIKALQWIGFFYVSWLLSFAILPVQVLETELWIQRERPLAARTLLCWIHPLRLLLLTPWLARSRYATQAWIAARGAAVVNRFWSTAEAQRYAGYIPTPVRLSGEFHAQLTTRDLKRLRQRRGAVVLISGPSGCGKKTLAIEIARQAAAGTIWGTRSLPLFLRPGTPVAPSIRQQVQELLEVPADQMPKYEPLMRRIETSYILPIVIEQSDRAAVGAYVTEIQAIAGRCPVIVVAADERLTLKAADVELEPVAPTGDLLQDFVKNDLRLREHNVEIAEDELTQLCGHVSNLRTSSPLPLVLLTMFLDDYWRGRSAGASWKPAESVVELCRRHIEWQISRAAGSGFLPDELRQDILELARMSTAKSFRPLAIKRNSVLKRLEGWNAARRLDVLEQQLQLVDIERGESDMVQFRHRHLALRLAAADRQASLDLGGNRWKSCLQQLRLAAQDSKSNIEPFALALYDCCVESSVSRPDFVMSELGHLAGLDAQLVEQHVLKQQTSAALSSLDAVDPQQRIDALQSLQRLALHAEPAMDALIDALGDVDAIFGRTASELLLEFGSAAVKPLCERLQSNDEKILLPTIELLQNMGPAAEPSIPQLSDVLASGTDMARAKAVCAIAAIAPNRLPPLERLLQNESAGEVRAAAATAYGSLKTSDDDVVETIATLLDDEVESVRIAAVNALGQIGLATVAAVAGLIKALVAEEEAVRRAAGFALSQLRGVPDAAIAGDSVRDAWQQSPRRDVAPSAAFGATAGTEKSEPNPHWQGALTP